jgi:hypothetical protein
MKPQTTQYWQAYSQRSPAWADVRLGTSTATVGGYGCTITALAAWLTEAGVTVAGLTTTPGVLNRWLARHGGFYQGNLLVFDSLRPLGVAMAAYIDCRRVPAPVDRLATALGEGHGVLVQVDFRPGGAQQMHWVRLLVLEDDDALVMDPWLPPEWAVTLLMPRYALPAWDGPARAIMRAVIYEPLDAAAAVVTQGAADARQEALCAAPWVIAAAADAGRDG